MLRVTFLLLLLGLAACPATPSTLDEDDATGDDDDDATPAPVALDALTAQIGEAVCEAVLGCCSMEDQGAWFAPVTNILELVGFESEVPPATALEAATCPALVEELLEAGPYRDWLDLAADGAVGYSETEAGACLERLRGARCGEELRGALFDAQCFSLVAPLSPERRLAFERTAGPGESCTVIRDGTGSRYYGSCNPQEAFCCYEDAATSGCANPFTGDGEAREGTCAAASGVGEPCSALPPLTLCAAGLVCGADGLCLDQPPLAEGEACMDESFVTLGVCQDGWCDLFGSRRCEPLGEIGTSCVTGDACASGSCLEGSCAENTLCGG